MKPAVGIVLGTGPSLNDVADMLRNPAPHWHLVGVNNTFEDFPLHCPEDPHRHSWIACDPSWHNFYGQVDGDFDKWHWDRGICDRYGYRYIEGRWFDGVSPPGADWISYNHGSGPQALNLATSIYCFDVVLLVGHDMRYNGQRHYFKGLSDVPGEYPAPLRKNSPFEKPKRKGGAHPEGDGILYNYRHIAEQDGLPPIINCTPGSAMTWFEMGDLRDWL